MIKVNDWLFIKTPLKCDSPDSKRGFTFGGKIQGFETIKVLDIKDFGIANTRRFQVPVRCAVVKVLYHTLTKPGMGDSFYFGSTKIIPMTEFDNTAAWKKDNNSYDELIERFNPNLDIKA